MLVRYLESLLIIIFISTFVWAQNLPQTQKELKNISENILIEYPKENSPETYFLFGLRENTQNQSTLYKSPKTDLSFLNWESLEFYEPIQALRVSERNSKIFFVFTQDGEIHSTTNNGYSFEKVDLESIHTMANPSDENWFEKVTKELEPTLNKQTLNFEKYPVPSITQTVWDTILWDTVQTLEMNNITSGAFAHGIVEAGDSGLVHVAVVKEDNLLRYFRSTDYGASFEPVVVIDDSIGGVIEVVVTGDYVYIFGGYSITLVPNPVPFLFSSHDKGLTWNQVYDFPPATKWIGTARNDTVYQYLESGAGGSVWQSKSFDGGLSFSTFEIIVDTVYATIQRPHVTIGENTIIYVRTGSITSLENVFVNVSPDLGDFWAQHLDISPLPNSNSDSPNISYSDSIFHTVQKAGGVIYKRSEDFGNIFSPYQGICVEIDSCATSIGIQISSYDSNVFPLWQQENLLPPNSPELLRTRFSRNHGVDWSPLINVSDEDSVYVGILTVFSTSIDDSLVYSAFVKANSTQTPTQKMVFRRGFYKFPLFDSIKKIELGVVDSLTTIDTTFMIQNKGVIPLVISQLDFPPEISTGLLALPFTIQPDSTFEFQIFFTPQSSGLYSDTLKFYTNQQIDPLKKIAINAEIFVDLEEKENLPDKIFLSQNFPNPFNPTTIINYQLPITNYENAKLTIFNILGEEVVSWQLNKNTANYGKIVWDGTDRFGNPVSSGVYFYQLNVGSFKKIRKMLLLK